MGHAFLQALPTGLTAFFASLVEFVEALTVVLAVGATRGWRNALAGSGLACLILIILVVVAGPLLTLVPFGTLQFAIGVLLLLFGLRWLQKAILRAAGVLPLHDEMAAYAAETRRLGGAASARSAWHAEGLAASFQITLIEGAEVVFVVIAIGSGRPDLLAVASLGAGAALLAVIALGFALHRPLARVPENGLKLMVGLLLSAFGTFWVAEGAGLAWPGGDWSLLALAFGYLVTALIGVALCRRQNRAHALPT